MAGPHAAPSAPRPFSPAAGDPLAAEHAAISRWVDEALAALPPDRWYVDVDLKSLPTGRALLAAGPAEARRYVLAAVAQLGHWDAEAENIRAQAKTDLERANAHLMQGWPEVWGPRRRVEAVVAALMGRALPFEKDDLLRILDWCTTAKETLTGYFAPIGRIVRAIERHAGQQPLAPDLRQALRLFARKLRASPDKDVQRLWTRIEPLCADAAPEEAVSERRERAAPPPEPAAAGHPAVLSALKRYLGLPSAEAEATTEEAGPDRFPLRADSPLRAEHELLDAIFRGVVGRPGYHHPRLDATDAGRSILSANPAARGRVLLAATERHASALLAPSRDYNDNAWWQSQYVAAGLVSTLAELAVEVDRASAFDLLLYLSVRPAHEVEALRPLREKLLAQVASEVVRGATLAEGERYVLLLLRASLIQGPPLGTPTEDVRQLTAWIGDEAAFFLVPGEAWADAVNAALGRLDPVERPRWVALLRHLLHATSARPSSKWLKTASALGAAVGAERVRDALEGWLPLVAQGRTLRKLGAYVGDTRTAGDLLHEENAICLRGILWLLPALPRAGKAVRLVGAVALSAYTKVPGVGPRAVKVGNAAIYALSEIGSADTVGQLAMLKVRVRLGTARKEIEKAFETAAGKLGLPRDQIEEMGVPSYGLYEVGLQRDTFAAGEVAAELRVHGSHAVISWFRAGGKPLKSVPAKVRSEHKADLKELQDAAKDIAAMLPALAARIDSMFLPRQRWPLSTWRERYLDHPLVGTIARRLIWNLRSGDSVHASVIWHDGRLVDVDDAPVDLPERTEAELWHPIGRPMDDVLAWRAWLARHEVRQPFKQAHREVYLLTDAELRTRTYSNRFAAHVLRQHQFNSLCAARDWRNKLRLMVDDVYTPATRELPGFGLRAEFWIQGIGDDYGVDTNESGAFLRVATDQVRFYRIGAAENLAHAGGGAYESRAAGPGADAINEPLPLDRIPPLVFSEIMRDVDLFVCVASVGNDPTWQDGGPGGRYRDYWHHYSFGELGETARTRRAVLEELLPRLKIAERCSLGERFLTVRGDLRTYKIHLGSGTIFMEPNDEYLCIVPAPPRGADDVSRLFLPFEGDATLSLILSKAFLLAADTRIADPTIVSQIRRG